MMIDRRNGLFLIRDGLKLCFGFTKDGQRIPSSVLSQLILGVDEQQELQKLSEMFGASKIMWMERAQFEACLRDSAAKKVPFSDLFMESIRDDQVFTPVHTDGDAPSAQGSVKNFFRSILDS